MPAHNVPPLSCGRMKRANWCRRSRLLLEGTFWSGMISLAFGIDETEFGAEALLLARAVITDWRIAKVIRLSQPPRGELLISRGRGTRSASRPRE